MVVFAHAGGLRMFWEIRGAGQIGVMLFFALSGFLMYMLYGNRGTSPDMLATYAVRRFFRIAPAFVFVVLASYVGYQSGWYKLYDIDTHELWLHLGLRGEVSVLWTIAVEVQFYILFPLILILFSRPLSYSAKTALMLVLYAIFVAVEFDIPKSLLWRFIEFFLAGMIAGSIYISTRPAPGAQGALNGLLVVGLTMLVLSIPRFVNPLLGVETGLWRDPLPYSLLVGALVLLAAWSTGLVARALANPLLTFVGKISFSLYLIHLPTMKFARDSLDLPATAECIISIAASLVLAYLLYRLIEVPGQQVGQWIIDARTKRQGLNKTPVLD